VLRDVEPNLADISLPDLDWFRDPLFWFAIGVPSIILVIAVLYFFWIDYRVKKLSKGETKGKLFGRAHKKKKRAAERGAALNLLFGRR